MTKEKIIIADTERLRPKANNIVAEVSDIDSALRLVERRLEDKLDTLILWKVI